MNDSQITDLLRALGVTMAVVDWIDLGLNALFGTHHVTGLTLPSAVLIFGSFAYPALRKARMLAAHKRLKRQVESLRPAGGDS